MNENFDSDKHPRGTGGRFAKKAVHETPDGTAALVGGSHHPSDERPVYDPDDYKYPNARIQPMGPEIDPLRGEPAIGPVGRVSTSRGIEYFDATWRLHREDGPAVAYPDGYTAWYLNGLMHREDGPAEIDVVGGVRRWFNHGRLLNEVRDDDARFGADVVPGDADGFVGPLLPAAA